MRSILSIAFVVVVCAGGLGHLLGPDLLALMPHGRIAP